MSQSTSAQQTRRDAINWIASVFSLVGLMIGMLVFFNGLYVSKEELLKERELRIIVQDQTNQQIQDLSSLVFRSHVRLTNEIKESKIYSIMIRRDLLESRSNLSEEEKSELRLLNRKISELSKETSNFDLLDVNMKMEISDMIKTIDKENP